MVRSKGAMPFSYFEEIDITELEALGAAVKLEQRGGSAQIDISTVHHDGTVQGFRPS